MGPRGVFIRNSFFKRNYIASNIKWNQMKQIFFYLILITLMVKNTSCEVSHQPGDLEQAICCKNSEKAIQILKRGINVNEYNNSTSFLHLALSHRLENVALILIAKGADVNVRDSIGYSPVHLAAKYGLHNVIDVLIKKDANLNFIDDAGYTPLNYAIISGNQSIIKQLLIHGAVTFHRGLPTMKDGPFVDYTEDGLLSYYLVHDSLMSTTTMQAKLFPHGTKQFKGWIADSLTYTIQDISKTEWVVNTNQPIFVLGDIHGQYDRMVQNLKENNVIGPDLKWTFGKGHLVFVGDIFDRGPKVTEALWFIYNLEQEAEKAGGKVHLILGNHELLVLENDLRYIHRKYEKLSEHTGLNHALLFHPNSVLGEWIRSKTTFLKINDILFVHAGVSEKLLRGKLSTEQINNLTADYLNGGENPHNEDDLDLVLGSFGPFWYRGYFKERSKYPLIKEAELDRIMNELDVKTIIVGHTENDKIKGYFNGKVINVNIPLADESVPNQALLIEKGKFYHYTEGTDEQIIK